MDEKRKISAAFRNLCHHFLSTVMVLTVWSDEPMVRGDGNAHCILVTLLPIQMFVFGWLLPSFGKHLGSTDCWTCHYEHWGIQTLFHSSSLKDWLESFLRSNIGRSNESGFIAFQVAEKPTQSGWTRQRNLLAPVTAKFTCRVQVWLDPESSSLWSRICLSPFFWSCFPLCWLQSEAGSFHMVNFSRSRWLCFQGPVHSKECCPSREWRPSYSPVPMRTSLIIPSKVHVGLDWIPGPI